jgi:hypothetical protein
MKKPRFSSKSRKNSDIEAGRIVSPQANDSSIRWIWALKVVVAVDVFLVVVAAILLIHVSGLGTATQPPAEVKALMEKSHLGNTNGASVPGK